MKKILQRHRAVITVDSQDNPVAVELQLIEDGSMAVCSVPDEDQIVAMNFGPEAVGVIADFRDTQKTCPHCGGKATRQDVEETLQYGATGRGEVFLKVQLPIFNCETCQFSYTDWVGEERRQAAVDIHLARKAMRDACARTIESGAAHVDLLTQSPKFAWMASDAVQEMSSLLLSLVASVVREIPLVPEPLPTVDEVPRASVHDLFKPEALELPADLKRLMRACARALPHVVGCSSCGGDGCGLCQGTGTVDHPLVTRLRAYLAGTPAPTQEDVVGLRRAYLVMKNACRVDERGAPVEEDRKALDTLARLLDDCERGATEDATTKPCARCAAANRRLDADFHCSTCYRELSVRLATALSLLKDCIHPGLEDGPKEAALDLAQRITRFLTRVEESA